MEWEGLSSDQSQRTDAPFAGGRSCPLRELGNPICPPGSLLLAYLVIEYDVESTEHGSTLQDFGKGAAESCR